MDLVHRGWEKCCLNLGGEKGKEIIMWRRSTRPNGVDCMWALLLSQTEVLQRRFSASHRGTMRTSDFC